MAMPRRFPSFVRLLRLGAAASLIAAIAAVATMLNDESPAQSKLLLGVSIGLAMIVLLGLALLLCAYRQKAKNDPRP